MIHLASSSYTIFFFNDTATTEIYTLSLHDALPISDLRGRTPLCLRTFGLLFRSTCLIIQVGDRKSTRLNSSHQIISYAVFCLKKKKTQSEPNRKKINSRHQKQYQHQQKQPAYRR